MPSGNSDTVAEARNTSVKISGTDTWDWQGVSNFQLLHELMENPFQYSKVLLFKAAGTKTF